MSASTITINVLSSVSTGATSGYFVLPGDFTEIFYPGYQFTFTGIGLLNLLYTVASSTLVNGTTQVNVNQSVVGSIVNTSGFTVGGGTYVAGTYQNVALNSSGNGSGATATVVVSGPGAIYVLNSTISGGTLYQPGTYYNVPLAGGTGTGATATVVVYPSGAVGSVGITTPGTGYSTGDVLSIGTSAITLGSSVGGSGYTNGSYSNVPLTGGNGYGARATIVVSGNTVTAVYLTNQGANYHAGDVLSAAASTIGGTGTGFSVMVASTTIQAGLGTGSGFAATVQSVLGTMTSVTITNPGVAYTVGTILTFGGVGFGLNNQLTVTQVTTTEVGTITLNATLPMFKYGQNIFCIVETLGNWGQSAGQGPYIGEWSWYGTDGWDWLNPIGPFVVSPQMQVPAVQGGQILQVQVTTNDSSQTPLVTYQIRLTGQTGVTTLHESLVFVDKPTALAAYSAMVT